MRTIVVLICTVLVVYAQDFTANPQRASDPDVVARASILAAGQPPALAIGQPLVNFGTTPISQLDLASYKGKLVVLYFFSSRCGRCPEASRQLGSLYLTTPKTDMVAFGIMSSHYPVTEALETAVKSRVAFPVFFDKDGQTFEAYAIHAVPIFALIDADGKLVKYCYMDRLRFCVMSELNKLRQARKPQAPAPAKPTT